MKKLRIFVLMHKDLVPPEGADGPSDRQIPPWQTEHDVCATLTALGHEVQPLGVADDPGVIRDAVINGKPNVIFNLLEEFHGLGMYVPFVLGYLELMRQPYTGCNPGALLLTRNKALMKKLLRFHRVPTPNFMLVPVGRAVRRPATLPFPLIVKSTTEHGSVGISQASVVHDDEKLRERVSFIHETLPSDAIVEEFVDGREVYVGLIGNQRLETFPLWEMDFGNLPDGSARIATEKVKWDVGYQNRTGIRTHAAANLPDGAAERIVTLAKRAYKLFGQTGYSRMDFRVTESGKVYLLESNPNPHLAITEDFAESAKAVGVEYPQLLQRILQLGLSYLPGWKDAES